MYVGKNLFMYLNIVYIVMWFVGFLFLGFDREIVVVGIVFGEMIYYWVYCYVWFFWVCGGFMGLIGFWN